jgi:hypothetical protein
MSETETKAKRGRKPLFHPGNGLYGLVGLLKKYENASVVHRILGTPASPVGLTKEQQADRKERIAFDLPPMVDFKDIKAEGLEGVQQRPNIATLCRIAARFGVELHRGRPKLESVADAA